MENENIAISLCKNNQLYKLIQYRSLCESIQQEINRMFYPLRQRVLRGYYLSQQINKKLSNVNKIISKNINDNSDMIKNIQSMQEEIDILYSDLKQRLMIKTESEIDYEDIEDSVLINMFDDNSIAIDFVNIRSLKRNLSTQIEIPIELTQNYTNQIGYNNNRNFSNVKGVQKISNALSDCIKVQEIQAYLSDIVQRAIEIRIIFKRSNNEDFLLDHNIEEIRGWLNAKS